MIRDSFVFYASWLDAIRALPKALQGDVLLSILEYGIEGKTVCRQGSVAMAMLTIVKPIIDANNKRYENGCRGGRPKGEQKPNENHSETTPKPNENHSETYNEDVYDNISSTTTSEDAHAREIEGSLIGDDSGKEKSCAKKESLPDGSVVASSRIAKVLSDDAEWVTSVALHFCKSENYIREQLKAFGEHVSLSEASKEITDARKHFISWVRKLESNERKTKRPTFGRNETDRLNDVRRAVAEGLAVAATDQEWQQ